MSDTAQDPLEFLKSMWGKLGFSIPGVVTPTVDVDELDKRVADLKAVEGWLKMNLGMLQMTIQGLEMQRATLSAWQNMGKAANSAEPAANPFAQPGLWPWNLATQSNGESETREEGRKSSSTRRKKSDAS